MELSVIGPLLLLQMCGPLEMSSGYRQMTMMIMMMVMMMMMIRRKTGEHLLLRARVDSERISKELLLHQFLTTSGRLSRLPIHKYGKTVQKTVSESDYQTLILLDMAPCLSF